MSWGSRHLSVKLDAGDALDVRQFSVHERMSSLFQITLVAVCEDADLDFDAVLGRPARFRMDRDGPEDEQPRFWTGLCNHIQQVAAEETGLSTYEISIVPTLWLSTQRRNHRMFQHISEIDTVVLLLSEWGVEPLLRIAGRYKKREYRVQYGESDFAFISRSLEEAGISFHFEQGEAETHLVLSDAPEAGARRAPLPFKDHPTALDRSYVTAMRVGQRVRPGRYTMRDHDPRLPPTYPLLASAGAKGEGVEARLERFHYAPGVFAFGGEAPGDSPFGDDRGATRTDEAEGAALAKKRLEAKRASAKVCTFEATALDLAPGVVTSIVDHPRSELAPQRSSLIVESTLEGTSHGQWKLRCEARPADVVYRPPLVTPKPRVTGVESATVVGPSGEEIHTDELGRVRVHFHWDRESAMNDKSSSWIPVSQPWGGAGFGGSNLPRVGQEVLVDFLGGDPDRPVIIGRLYTSLQKTPYKLPDNKTQSGWQSRSSPGGGGDNHNELMFEDAAGKELVRMQAEKDLNKLVKNDEIVRIGHDRRKRVEHDDALVVGNDQTILVVHDRVKEVGVDQSEIIGSNKSIQVGKNHTETIGENETLMVGGDRAKTVGGSQSESIGVNKSIEVGAHHSESVGESMSLAVGGGMSETVGKTKTETVTLASTETVGLAKTLTVGGAYAITVGAMMSTNVIGKSTEQVGFAKSISAGTKFSVECGSSKLTMDKAGNVVIEASNMTITSSGPVKVAAKGPVDVETPGVVKVKGGTISMN